MSPIPGYVLGAGIACVAERGRFREWLERMRLELLASAERTNRNDPELDKIARHLITAALELSAVKLLME